MSFIRNCVNEGVIIQSIHFILSVMIKKISYYFQKTKTIH